MRKSWELTDTDSGKYYRILGSAADCSGETVFCHHITDVSDYADLYQEITEYSQKISDAFDFQTEILKNIASSYINCLPILAEFCSSNEAVIYLEDTKRDLFIRGVFNGKLSVEQSVPDVKNCAVFESDRFDSVLG